jgi:GNAT superfamily N-acetyltransferase
MTRAKKVPPPLSVDVGVRLPRSAVDFALTARLVRGDDDHEGAEPWHATLDEEQPPHVRYVVEMLVDAERTGFAIGEAGSAGSAWRQADQARLNAHVPASGRLVIARAHLFEFPRAWVQGIGIPYWDAFDMMPDGPLGALGMATDFLDEMSAGVISGYARSRGSMIVLHGVEVLPAFRRLGFGQQVVERAVRAISRDPTDFIIACSTPMQLGNPLLADFKDHLTRAQCADYLRGLAFAQFMLPPDERARADRIERGIGDFGSGETQTFFRPVRPAEQFRTTALDDEGDLFLALNAWVVGSVDDPSSMLYDANGDVYAEKDDDDFDDDELDDDDEFDDDARDEPDPTSGPPHGTDEPAGSQTPRLRSDISLN